MPTHDPLTDTYGGQFAATWPDTGRIGPVPRTNVTITTEIDLDIATGAKWFSGLTDDQMAEFFIAVEKESRDWPGFPDTMWCYLGKHLAECECSSANVRDMLRSIVAYMNHYSEASGHSA